jgi:hypothetical protein
MTEHRWAWLIWLGGFLSLLLMSVLSLGFTIPILALWWMGGPFGFSREGEIGPDWHPPRPAKLWWRDAR